MVDRRFLTCGIGVGGLIGDYCRGSFVFGLFAAWVGNSDLRAVWIILACGNVNTDRVVGNCGLFLTAGPS